MAAAYLLVWRSWDSIGADFPAVGELYLRLQTLEPLYLIGGLAFAAYLLGAAVGGLSSWAAASVIALASGIETRIRNSNAKASKRWRLYLYRRSDRHPVRSRVMDTVSAKFSGGGLDSIAYLSFPFETVEDQLESMSLQLWHKAPDQYQESDRLRAESSFRIGVALPLALIGLELSIQVAWWVGVGFAAAAVVLILQARQLSQERRALLANAVYQGLAENSTLESVVRILKELELPAKKSMLTWYAATAIALDRAGDIGSFESVVKEGAIEVSQEVNFDSPNWKKDVKVALAGMQRVFVANENEGGSEYMSRMVARAQARVEAVWETLEPGETRDRAGRRAWYGR